MTIRHKLLLVHRYAGIALAAFLVLAGATGSFLAFHHEIDAALAPELHRVSPQATHARFDAIAGHIEARHPHLVVGYFVLAPDAGKSVRAVMNTREAANAGKLDREAARHAEVFADPYSGKLLGERYWGELGATRAHVVPMVYRLHTSLFLGTAGQWITASIAATWIVALLIGFALAVPRLRLVAKAFTIRLRASRARAFFDVHRTLGLSAGAILLVSAFTGLYMNLPDVVEPLVAAVSPFTARPAAVRQPKEAREEVWRVGWDAAYASARAAEPRHPVVILGRVESRGYYQARFLTPKDITDAGSIRLFVSGRDGAVVGRFHDREGTAGDVIRIWQWPLHSGYAFGLAGRVLVCVAGWVPLILAATGLWLWLRRRRLRREWAEPRGYRGALIPEPPSTAGQSRST